MRLQKTAKRFEFHLVQASFLLSFRRLLRSQQIGQSSISAEIIIRWEWLCAMCCTRARTHFPSEFEISSRRYAFRTVHVSTVRIRSPAPSASLKSRAKQTRLLDDSITNLHFFFAPAIDSPLIRTRGMQLRSSNGFVFRYASALHATSAVCSFPRCREM